MGRELSSAAVLVMVAVLALQGVGGAFAASGGPVADGPSQPADASPADEIYVEENGDAVLVYESSSGDGPNRTEFGVDVAENVAYVLVEDPVEGPPDVTGGLEATANRTAITADGNLTASRPETLEAFDLALSSETTSETARTDLDLTATVRDESGTSRLIDSAWTNGTVRTTADRLVASATLDVDPAIPVPENTHQSLAFDLREDGDAYVLSMAESRPVDPLVGDAPQNRSAAVRALESQYESLAGQLNGTATVDVEEFDREDIGDQVRVEQAYTVRFEGIDESVGAMLERDILRESSVDRDQAEALAESLADVDVRELSLEYRVDADGVSGNLDVDVANYGPLVSAYFDLVTTLEDSSSEGIDAERMAERFEAQRAADLERTVTWSANLTHPDDERVTATVDVASRTDNRSAFVDELRARDVPVLTTRYDVTGGIDDEEITVDGAASVSGERLYEELLRGLQADEQLSSPGPSIENAIRDSRPQKARLVTTYDADGFRFEAGATFGNLSALRDAISAEADLPPVTEAVGRQDATSGETVVRVSNAVGTDATESSVRELPYVDEGTTIYMPGEGDREFPSMDVDRAESFLEGVEGSSAFGPGFGVVATVVGLLGAGLLLSRRR